MAGRKPKPTNILKLHGTYQKSRRSIEEPQPELVIPEMPDWLSDEAKKEWNRIVPILFNGKVLTNFDGNSLAAMCQSYADYVRARNDVENKRDKESFLIGSVEYKRLTGIMNNAFDKWVKLMIEFGLTPSSRTRVRIAKENREKNPFVKMISDADAG